MRVSSTPHSIALSGVGGQRDHAAIGIVDAALAPSIASADSRVEHRLGGGEGLGGDREQRRRRIEARRTPPRARRRRRWRRSRPHSDRRRGPARRPASSGPSADPPMPMWRTWRIAPSASASIASISARIRAWKRLRAGDALRAALAALGGVLGGAALGRVDDLAREQRLALGGQALRLGQRLERGRAPPRSDASWTSRSGCPRHRRAVWSAGPDRPRTRFRAWARAAPRSSSSRQAWQHLR